jgi:hypothetical protein
MESARAIGSGERLAVDVLHYQVERGGLDDDGVQPDDVRVVDARERPSFGQRACTKLGVVGELGANRLHDDRRLGVDVACEVHDPHASLTQDLVDLVFAVDERAGGKIARRLLPGRALALLAVGDDAPEREAAADAKRRVVVVFELTRRTALHARSLIVPRGSEGYVQ